MLAGELDSGTAELRGSDEDAAFGSVVNERHANELLDVRRPDLASWSEPFALDYGALTLRSSRRQVGAEVSRSANVSDMAVPEIVEQMPDGLLELLRGQSKQLIEPQLLGSLTSPAQV
jgi:hypothetical protein